MKCLWNVFIRHPTNQSQAPFSPKPSHKANSLYSWMKYIKEPPKQCLWLLLHFFLPHLVFIQPWICTVIQSNALEQRWRRREKRGGNAITCVTSQVALNFCVNLHCNLNPDTGCLLNKQYKPSILFCGLFQLSDFFFWRMVGLLWISCIIISFLLSLWGKGLSDLSDPPWMQLHA